MKKILLLSIMLFFASCAIKIVPLTGSYSEVPYQIKTDLTFDEAWSRTIDLFAEKGITITVIDKSSGIIVAGKTLLSATTEGKDGKPRDSTASVVVAKAIDPGPMRAYPIGRTTGDWNVRIKAGQDGRAIININLVNISSATVIDTKTHGTITLDGKSTGNFERLIASIITEAR